VLLGTILVILFLLAILVILLVLVNNEWDRRASENFIFLLKYKRKFRNKKLGAHKPIDFKLQQSGKNQNRPFSTFSFDKIRWLTVSEEKKSFFCFVCVLFGGESNWTVTGIIDLKHLSERVKKHEASAVHIENDVKFNLFGSVL
jgi:hypothetical protein